MGIGKVIRIIFLLLFLVIIVVPFLWLAVSSFKSNLDFFSRPLGLPRSWSLNNYVSVFLEEPMLLFLMNSIVVTVSSTLVGILVASMASYVFLYQFRGKTILSNILSFGIFMPLSSFMLPYFLIVRYLGILNTLLGISLVYTGILIPLSFLIINSYMKVIVYNELLEAAVLDGANFHQIYAQIVLPVSMRGISTAAIFLIISHWNELLYALLLSQSETSRTVQVAISFLLATYAANYPRAFAAMFIAILPMIIIYILLNKHIVSGLGVTVGLK